MDCAVYTGCFLECPATHVTVTPACLSIETPRALLAESKIGGLFPRSSSLFFFFFFIPLTRPLNPRLVIARDRTPFAHGNGVDQKNVPVNLPGPIDWTSPNASHKGIRAIKRNTRPPARIGRLVRAPYLVGVAPFLHLLVPVVPRAVQQATRGGQFDFTWSSTRAMHPHVGARHLWWA